MVPVGGRTLEGKVGVVTGAAVSYANVRAPADATLFTLSRARAWTVYWPFAGKFDDGKANDQLVVPVAVRQFSVASANAIPFQYWSSELRLIDTSTFWSPAPPLSAALPEKSLQPPAL